MIDDAARFELHEGLREVLGEARGDTLMSMLPPTGWSEVATKHDLAAVSARVDQATAELERRLLAEFDSRLHREVNRQTWWSIAALGTIAALLTANNVL